MTYRVARGGQVFGPYSEVEVRQYIASGNIGPTDRIQLENGEWAPVPSLFPMQAASPMAAVPVPGPRAVYPNPPDLPWWALLGLGIVTSGVFFVVWDIVQAGWLKRIHRESTAILLYIGVAVLYFSKLPGFWASEGFGIFSGSHLHLPGMGLLATIVAIIARFVFRRELLEHFNNREGIGLRLNGFWTLVLGGLYFQWHFNRINELKKGARPNLSAA